MDKPDKRRSSPAVAKVVGFHTTSIHPDHVSQNGGSPGTSSASKQC